MIALRPDGDGHIKGYSGIDEVQARHAEWVIGKAGILLGRDEGIDLSLGGLAE